MKLLLINKNPVVSRMMKMSVPKAGFEIEESEDVYNLPSGEYDVVVIDDEMYDENFWEVVKKSVQYKKAGLIKGSKAQEAEGFDFVLSKPFLPTDLIEILRTIKTEIELRQESLGHEPTEQGESIVEIEEEPEESPFVSEPMEKSGILDESEVQQVAQLLEDEEPSQESIEEQESAEEQKDIDEQEVQEEFAHDSQSLETAQEEPVKIEEVEPTETEEIESAQIEEEGIDEEKSEQEREMETAVSMVEPLSQESEEIQMAESEEIPVESGVMQEEKVDQEEHQEENQSGGSNEDIIPAKGAEEAVETPVKPATKPVDILHEVSSLPLASLKELLDGMRLDITIKISFPDRKDV